jgi:hypothetical protein
MKFLKAGLVSLILSISWVASAGLIDSSKWQISNIEGNYSSAYTDWATVYGVDDHDIKSLLSDSVLGCDRSNAYCGVNAMQGPNWAGFTSDEQSLTVDFSSLYAFTDIDLFVTRAERIGVQVLFFNDDSHVASTQWEPELARNQGWVGIDSAITANRIVFDFYRTSGLDRQFIMHEFRFNGNEVIPNATVPEPTTLAIFALGMIGLASRRFKKQ